MGAFAPPSAAAVVPRRAQVPVRAAAGERPRGLTLLAEAAGEIASRVRTGRFQRWLGLVAGLSSVLSGVEVTYEHYRGSYSRRIMYSPVILSGALAIVGVAAFRSRRVARTALPALSAITVLDCAIGTYFHIRGIQRKPGGWRLPVNNIIMGPPIFGPLLFGTSAYLGLMASFLQRDERPLLPMSTPGASLPVPAPVAGWRENLRHGRFQRHLAVITAISAFCSGVEATYSHYKSNFRYKAQWTPVAIAPALTLAGLGTIVSARAGRTVLPATASLAMLDGAVGFFYHARGVLRRPGGRKLLFYNIIYGPPIFAPLLLSSAGFIGLLTSLLRRENEVDHTEI